MKAILIGLMLLSSVPALSSVCNVEVEMFSDHTYSRYSSYESSSLFNSSLHEKALLLAILDSDSSNVNISYKKGAFDHEEKSYKLKIQVRPGVVDQDNYVATLVNEKEDILFSNKRFGSPVRTDFSSSKSHLKYITWLNINNLAKIVEAVSKSCKL